ncbi:MAG: hypothetical protein MZU97_08470 [Bacillus subtilis]|nr:hypothetical protein [Bacillus subtilis]
MRTSFLTPDEEDAQIVTVRGVYIGTVTVRALDRRIQRRVRCHHHQGNLERLPAIPARRLGQWHSITIRTS